MKTKKTRSLFLTLLLSVLFVLVSVFTVACDRENDVLDDGPEGIYYYDAGNDEYTISLFSNYQFSLAMGSSVKMGYYTLEGNSLTLVPNKADEAPIAATLIDDVLTMNPSGASWRFLKKITYSVTYNLDGGTGSVSEVSVMNGKTVSKPADPVRDGYVFLGWYADAGYTKPFAFDSEAVSADITLYARWGATVIGQSEYTVNFDAGENSSETFEGITTIGGKLYEVPTPAAISGYTFAGWWISDYQDADRLTTAWTESTVFNQNTTLFALWKDTTAAPDVRVSATGIEWDAQAGVTYKYSIYKNDIAIVAEQSTGSSNIAYDFSAQDEGDYVIRVTANNTATTTRYFRNKALARVSLFTVVDPSTLIFNAVEGAERYYITVECGDSSHTHDYFDNGSSTYFNFANCPMTDEGIKFTVTAVADGYGSSVSETFVYKRTLAQISGFTFNESEQTVVWSAVEGAASYVVKVTVDGNPVTSEDIGNKTSFSLKEYGAGNIVVSVYPKTKGYISPDAATYTYKKTNLAAPSDVRIEGDILKWEAVDGATAYDVTLDGKTVASNVETNYFDLTELNEFNWITGDYYQFCVRAKGASDSTYSLYSDGLDARYYALSRTIRYEASTLSWGYVIGAQSYEVAVGSVEDPETYITVVGKNSLEITLPQAGENVLYVRYNDGSDPSEWARISVYAYTIEFDSMGGTAVDSVYVAIGDKVVLPDDVTRTNYDFAGWYNAPVSYHNNVAALYTDEYYSQAGDMVLHAFWTPKQMSAIYQSFGAYGEEFETESTPVFYGENYVLEVPESNDAQYGFIGWFSEPAGGTQYTDENGVSLRPWDSTQSIYMYAQWANLLTFTLQTGVQYYNTYAVMMGADINRVSTITIPAEYKGQRVSIVEGFAFKNCLGLTEINIPDTVEIIYDTSFNGCSALEAVNIYHVEGNNIIMYTSHDGSLVYYNEVTKEYQLAFVPMSKTGIYAIPEGVTEIPLKIFASSQISEVVIPTSVQVIRANAFYNCKELATVTFVAGGTADLTIEIGAFYGCTALAKITFPERATDLAFAQLLSDTETSVKVGSIFTNCSILTSIEFAKGNPVYSAIDGIVFDASGETLIYCSPARKGAYTIPSGVKKIGENAFFNCTGITEIIIPNWVTEIGAKAFYQCVGIRQVTFMGNARADLVIGDKAFGFNSTLRNVNFEDGNRVTEIGQYAFQNCISLTEFVFPANLTYVDNKAFFECTKLGEVYFAEGGGSVEFGTNVFQGCTLLRYVYFPASYNNIHMEAFVDCTSLMAVYVDEGNQYYVSKDGILLTVKEDELLYYPRTFGSEGYTIPDTVTTIGGGVFRANTLLTSITIPASVTKIESYAFYQCNNLASVTFLPAAEGEDEQPLTFGDYVFSNCGALKEFVYPDRAVNTGAYTFESAGALQTIIFSEGITVIQDHICQNNVALKTAILPASVTTIQTNAFYQCTNLSDIGNTENITRIEVYGFFKINITELSLPKIEYLGDRSLSNLKITRFDIPATLRTVGQNVCLNNTLLKEVTVASGATTIGYAMFSGCTLLEEVYIPNTVTVVGREAFKGCTKLKTVTFEEGGTKPLQFGTYSTATMNAGSTFYGCTALTEFTFPARTSEIGNTLFSGCTNLETVTFEAGCTIGKIFYGTFTNCSKLTSITLPATAKLLNSGSTDAIGVTYQFTNFTGCTSLTEINIAAEDGVGTYFSSQDGILYNADKTALIVCPQGKEGTITVPNSVKDVCLLAFNGCSKITKVEFEAGGEGTLNLPAATVKSETSASFYISAGALFTGCTSLREVIIPDRLETVTAGLFSGGTVGSSSTKCSGLPALETVILPSDGSLKTIDYGAFWKDTALTSITIPYSVTAINNLAFYNCTNLSSLMFAGVPTAEEEDKEIDEGVTEGETTEGETTEPAPAVPAITAADLPDLVISNYYVFAMCTALTSVVIPARTTSIGTYAFYQCKGITSFSFEDTEENPSRLTSLGNYALGGTAAAPGPATESLVLPTKLTTLGTFVFAYSGIKDLTLSKSIMSFISSLVNVSLENVYVQDGSTSYKSIDGVVFNSAGTTLAYYPINHDAGTTEYTIPAGVTSIGDYAFYYNTTLTKIIIPAEVKSVGTYAFSRCVVSDFEFETREDGSSDLTSIGNYAFHYEQTMTGITLPDSVTSIGTYAFAYCTKLTSFTFPKDITVISGYIFQGCSALATVEFLGNITEIGAYAFTACAKLEMSSLPDTLKTIGNYAFNGCKLVTFTTLPSGVNSLGTYVFNGCTGITSFTLPASITAIPNYMFNGCTSLQTVVIEGNVTSIGTSAFQNCPITSVTIPDSVVSIGNYAFMGARFSEITIPEKVNTIGNYAFQNNTNLTTVNFVENATAANISLGAYAFANCTGLQEIVLSDRIETILIASSTMPYTYLFSGCTALERVVLPDSCTITTTKNMFSKCTSLKEVVFPTNGLTEITANTFEGLTLEKVELPANITTIGDSAFSGCVNLTSVIMHGVTSIGANAFSGCVGLTVFEVPATVITIGAGAFTGVPVFSLEEGSMDFLYQDGVLYGDGGSSIIQSFGGYESVTIPDGVTSISASAFAGNTDLKHITLPADVLSIGDSAFRGCTSLETVTFKGVMLFSLGDYVFEGCTSLKAISLPAGITQILGHVFENCTSLTSVTLPSTLTTLGTSQGNADSPVFGNCTSLTEIVIPASVWWVCNRVFFNCEKLESVTFLSGGSSGTGLTITTGAFENCKALTEVIFPENLGSIQLLGEVFKGCSSLSEIDFTSLRVTVGTDAFSGCMSLETVHFREDGDSVTLNTGAFRNSGLRTITLPAGYTATANETFSGCVNLESVTFNGVIKSIPASYFSGCSKLSEINFADASAITSIGDNAFKGCILLTSFTLTDSIITLGANVFEGWTTAQIIVLDGVTQTDLPEGWSENWYTGSSATIREN